MSTLPSYRPSSFSFLFHFFSFISLWLNSHDRGSIDKPLEKKSWLASWSSIWPRLPGSCLSFEKVLKPNAYFQPCSDQLPAVHQFHSYNQWIDHRLLAGGHWEERGRAHSPAKCLPFDEFFKILFLFLVGRFLATTYISRYCRFQTKH
jgi:hypothetical protein